MLALTLAIHLIRSAVSCESLESKDSQTPEQIPFPGVRSKPPQRKRASHDSHREEQFRDDDILLARWDNGLVFIVRRKEAEERRRIRKIEADERLRMSAERNGLLARIREKLGML